jgi:hypothetical protein
MSQWFSEMARSLTRTSPRCGSGSSCRARSGGHSGRHAFNHSVAPRSLPAINIGRASIIEIAILHGVSELGFLQL